jgi:hypothetical protein
MIATWKQYEGQAVDGIPLLRLLGGGEASAVYLGELAGQQCAIKLAPADEAAAQIPLARWQQASKLTHPHLTKIHQWGRARLDGASLVYLAMEFAEEELGGVDRPLTPKEVREMLTPAVSALAYLHSQKCAHGRVQPSNILSVNDVLKLSGDAPLRFGERHAARLTESLYDAPELTSAGLTASGDVWSLGVTLVAALTKELPVIEGDAVRLPNSLKPDSFREVAMGCLRRDPAERWSMADVAQWLERGTVPAPKRVSSKRYLVPAAAVAAVAVVGAVALPHFGRNQASSPAPAPTVATTQKPADPASQLSPAPPAVAPAPAPVAQVPAAKIPPLPKPKPALVPAPPIEDAPETAKAGAPASPPPTPAQTGPSPADVIPADVVQSVRPDVPAKARATIHGKVPIFVRVEADAGGAVSSAQIESGGTSKYFADLALKAAKQWKFAPGDGEHVWILKFEFTHGTEHAVSMQANRVK